MCERFAIAGMQEEVENTLRFKARSGPVPVPGWVDEPNYYNILWAFFVYRLDYKNGECPFSDCDT